MEKEKEATIVKLVILGFYRDNGKENGNYYSIMGNLRVILENSLKTLPQLKLSSTTIGRSVSFDRATWKTVCRLAHQ